MKPKPVDMGPRWDLLGRVPPERVRRRGLERLRTTEFIEAIEREVMPPSEPYPLTLNISGNTFVEAAPDPQVPLALSGGDCPELPPEPIQTAYNAVRWMQDFYRDAVWARWPSAPTSNATPPVEEF